MNLIDLENKGQISFIEFYNVIQCKYKIYGK